MTKNFIKANDRIWKFFTVMIIFTVLEELKDSMCMCERSRKHKQDAEIGIWRGCCEYYIAMCVKN